MKSVHPLVPFAFAIVLTSGSSTTSAQNWMLKMIHEGREVVGQPLKWDQQYFTMLARDGQLHRLEMDALQQGETIRASFSSYPQGYMRGQLSQEFGSAFEVTGTGHYLVVHPTGQREWAQRFEELYREMMHYFGARGISVRRPAFPLVAVVFPTRSAFFEYNAANGGPTNGTVLGYYDADTNRILLYDVTANGRASGDWRRNAETIVHEAAHQTAFNVGIHSRYTMPPRFLAEGLGTLFETPGVYAGSSHPRLADRVNQEQLSAFRRYFSNGIPDGMLAALVADDDAFRRASFPSYALSWAFTFMVAETQPSKLSRYLKVTAGKKPFSNVSRSERIRDFQAIFGTDFKMTRARLERYMADL